MEICLIDAEGLDEEIRCEMCRNPMRSNTGCDGGCTYDEKLYEKIVHLLNERIKPLPNIKPEPERKTGRWIPQDHNRRSGYVTTTVYYYPKCSECGHSGNYDMSYCPNCGAYMGGGQDDKP